MKYETFNDYENKGEGLPIIERNKDIYTKLLNYLIASIPE